MHIFIISISGKQRVSKSTLRLIDYVEKHGGVVYWIGEDRIQFESLKSSDFELAEFVTGGPLSKGEIECLLNHQKIYNKIIELEIPSALVLEDDANLIVSVQKLCSIIKKCESSNYDLINFHSTLGAVLFGRKNREFLRALIPPLSAFSYWISNHGSYLMYSNDVFTGVADWPINIYKLKSAVTKENLFIHGKSKSFIEPTLDRSAKERIHISYQPFKKIFALKNLYSIIKLIRILKIGVFFKVIVYLRIVKRLSRILYRKKNNSSVKFIY